jgi:hypothetical protein
MYERRHADRPASDSPRRDPGLKLRAVYFRDAHKTDQRHAHGVADELPV